MIGLHPSCELIAFVHRGCVRLVGHGHRASHLIEAAEVLVQLRRCVGRRAQRVDIRDCIVGGGINSSDTALDEFGQGFLPRL